MIPVKGSCIDEMEEMHQLMRQSRDNPSLDANQAQTIQKLSQIFLEAKETSFNAILKRQSQINTFSNSLLEEVKRDPFEPHKELLEETQAQETEAEKLRNKLLQQMQETQSKIDQLSSVIPKLQSSLERAKAASSIPIPPDPNVQRFSEWGAHAIKTQVSRGKTQP